MRPSAAARAWQLVTVRSVGAEDGAARATPTGCIIRAVATASDDVLGEAQPARGPSWLFPAALFADAGGEVVFVPGAACPRMQPPLIFFRPADAGARKKELAEAVLAATGRPLSDTAYSRIMQAYATTAGGLWRLRLPPGDESNKLRGAMASEAEAALAAARKAGAAASAAGPPTA
jgi:hypothetical protein